VIAGGTVTVMMMYAVLLNQIAQLAVQSDTSGYLQPTYPKKNG